MKASKGQADSLTTREKVINIWRGSFLARARCSPLTDVDKPTHCGSLVLAGKYAAIRAFFQHTTLQRSSCFMYVIRCSAQKHNLTRNMKITVP